jgi:hypothetical protein
VLARKYRPQTFAEVVGQEHVATTLRNAILEGRVAHAYLFAGPRGVGKTSMARILAKARLKLRGEMPADVMYGCGGDRAFLARVNLTSPEFLQWVRDHEHDDGPIVEAVKRRASNSHFDPTGG